MRETSSVFSLLVCCRFTLNVCCARSYVLFPFFVADNLNFFLMYLSAIFAVLLLFFLALSPTYLTSCLLFMCVCCRFTLNVCWAHSFLPVRVVSIFCCCCCCFFLLRHLRFNYVFGACLVGLFFCVMFSAVLFLPVLTDLLPLVY